MIFLGALLLRGAGPGFGGDHSWQLALSGLCGALGLVTFYLALERTQASTVVPVIGVYPIITAALALGFLGESLNLTQFAGLTCAVVGVVRIGAGS